MIVSLVALTGILLALGVIGASAVPRQGGGSVRRVVYGGSALVGAAIALVVLVLLARSGGGIDWGGRAIMSLPLGLPWLRAHFAVDPLSAYFLLVANGAGAVISLFALGYGRREAEPIRVLPFYPLFLAAMNLVLMAADAFVFLFAWELMALTSWLLVLASHREADTPRAAYIYFVMALLGTLGLLLAFGLLAGGAGDYRFAAMRGQTLAPGLGLAVAVLALLGAGSKAGLMPLHAWLPLAHPAAPSHVSALLSGVMTKVAIYGFVRLTFDLAGDLPWWWGAVVLAVGAVSAVLGVLYALMERDLKRLLAYSTVENIGVIAVGLGLALAFRANGMAALAALAFAAALLHVLNHALFKSLLFCGAGAVQMATGERDLEKLGGLVHRMPETALAFLIGAAAISALPPLNGFASEWLLFQAILQGTTLPQWLLKFGVPVVGAFLALAAALAAACFVNAFGAGFLGRPRTLAAARAEEVDGSMRAAMALLAALCLAVGVVPGAIIALIDPVSAASVGARIGDAAGASLLWLAPLGQGQGSYSGLAVLLAILALTAITVLLVRRHARKGLRRAAPWDGGFPDPRPETQYTASSFAQPIRRILGPALLCDFAWEWFYAPVARAVGRSADAVNPLRLLASHNYLALMFAALVALLVVVALAA
jgi:hydrogenase-4 component B